MKFLVPALLLALGGCTTPAVLGPDAQLFRASALARQDNCTDVIAANGGILKFCQTARAVDIYESGVDMRNPAPPVGLVDDPRVLAALQAKLTLRPEFAQSRRFVARSCMLGDSRYLTISVESLKRILRAQAQRIVLRDARVSHSPDTTESVTPSVPKADMSDIPPMPDPR